MTVGPAPERAEGTLSWKVDNLLSTASGSVACRIRLKPQPTVLWASKVAKTEPNAHTLAALTDTGGGEWFLSVWENPYVKPEKPAPPPELGELEVDLSASGDGAAPPSLDLEKEPEGVVVCQAGMKLFDTGLADSALLWADVEKAGQWHHLVWIWNSVQHRLYLDGRLLAESQALSRLQPPADGCGTLTLFTDVAELRDFRVFRRALTDEEVANLAAADPDAPATPLPMPFRIRADWGRLTGRAVIYVETGALAPARVEVAFIQSDGNVLRERELTRFPDGLGEDACAVTANEAAFPPGTYHVEAVAYDDAGRELARARSAEWAAEPLEAPYAEYIGSRIGAEDAKVDILPPFTPIEVEETVLKTALREHRLARTGLPASILAAGEELLGGPVHVAARMNGNLLDFAGGPGLAKIGNRTSFNVLAGDSAYIADDGTRQIGFLWSEGRAWFRRIKQVFADNGILDSGGVWAHTTRWKGLPFFTFADMSMDGEWPAIWVTPFSDYVSYYYSSLEMNRGYASGKAFGFVGTQMFHGNVALKEYPHNLIASRTYLGVTLPCDVMPMSTSVEAELQRVNNIGVAAGIFDSDAIEDIDAAEIDGLWVAGWRHPGRRHALLYVLTRNVSGEVDISRVIEYAGLGGEVEVFDAETGVALQTTSGWRLNRELHDFGVLWVRAGEDAPPPRAVDHMLQLAFDKGLEPETGGLIAPVRVASTPVFGEGNSGQALAVGAGQAPVAYPIVPAPASGTLRFALAVDRLAPVRLVALREWMDTDLSLVVDKGCPALKLDVREEGKTRAATWLLPENAGWRRISLTWRAGHFELWCDGNLMGELGEPVAPVYQSAAFPAYGLMLGDEPGAGRGQARIDDLGLHARPLDTPGELRAWLWGREPNFHAGVWFGDHALRQEVVSVRFSVLDPQADGSLYEQMAAAMWDQAVGQSDVCIDRHGWSGRSASLVWGHRRDAELVRAFGLDIHMIKDDLDADAQRGGRLETACFQAGIQSLTAELTPQNLLCERSVRAGERGLRNVMKALGMLEGEPDLSESRYAFDEGDDERVLTAPIAGLLVCDRQPPAPVRQGEVVARLVDLNNVLHVEEIVSPLDGVLFNTGPAWGEAMPESSIVDAGERVALVKTCRIMGGRP